MSGTTIPLSNCIQNRLVTCDRCSLGSYKLRGPRITVPCALGVIPHAVLGVWVSSPCKLCVRCAHLCETKGLSVASNRIASAHCYARNLQPPQSGLVPPAFICREVGYLPNRALGGEWLTLAYSKDVRCCNLWNINQNINSYRDL